MNIVDNVWKFAERLGLDWICTGGGCDFICKDVYIDEDDKEKGCYQLVLGSQEDIGSSPDKLGEPSCVSIYAPQSSWMESIIIPFGSATKAMNFMAKQHQVFSNMTKEDRKLQEFFHETGVHEGEADLVRAFLKGVRQQKLAYQIAKEPKEPPPKKFEVSWRKGYFCTGTEVVEARNKEEAEEIMAEMIGDMTGSMQYDDADEAIEVIKEIK